MPGLPNIAESEHWNDDEIKNAQFSIWILWQSRRFWQCPDPFNPCLPW